MPTGGENWMNEIGAWFARRPEREFRMVKLPLASLPDVGRAGWIAGTISSARQAPGAASIMVVEGATAVPCIIRRADPGEGRNLPGVLLLDGGRSALPLVPPSPDPARAEEQFCGWVWSVAQTAIARGISPRALLIDQALRGLNTQA